MREHFVIVAAGLAATSSVEVIADVQCESTFLRVATDPQASLVHILVHLIVTCPVEDLTSIPGSKSEHKGLPSAIELLPRDPLFEAKRPELMPPLIFQYHQGHVLTLDLLHESDLAHPMIRHTIQQFPLQTSVHAAHSLGKV